VTDNFKYSDYVKYLSDQRWRLDHLYTIINAEGEEIKFELNQVQAQLFENLWYNNVVLKSRQQGITTFACVDFLDTCLFKKNIAACIIAHNREDAENFFYRNILAPYEKLPEELKSLITLEKETERALRFSNGSSIRVTTSGRSGTFQLLHVSEMGKMDAKFPQKAKEVKLGALNAVHAGKSITIIESTAEGREGIFFDHCESAQKLKADKNRELSVMDFKFFFFPWYKSQLNQLHDPRVIINSRLTTYFDDIEREKKVKIPMAYRRWYVKKEESIGFDIKQEHPSTPEEAFEVSIEGAYYTTQFRKIRETGRICSVPHRETNLVDTWWDLGYRDEMVIWFTQDMGREIHVIDFYANSGEGFGHFAEILEQKKYRYGRHTPPHDIDNHVLSAQTNRQMAADVGIMFEEASPKLSIDVGIGMVRKILGICWFDASEAEEGLKSLEAYRKEWNDRLGSYHDRPLHDWSSHAADAFRTLATAHQFNNQFIATARSRVDSGIIERSNRRADPRGWAA